MYKELKERQCYNDIYDKLLKKLEHHKQQWKEGELQRKQYREMMVSNLNESIQKEEYAIKVLKSNLESVKSLHATYTSQIPPKAPTVQTQPFMQTAQNYPIPATSYSKVSVVEPDEESQYSIDTAQESLSSAYPQPMETNHTSDIGETNLIEIDTNNYTSTSMQLPPEHPFPNYSMPMPVQRTVQWSSVQVDEQGESRQLVHYELSVSPWFHEVKKRRIDIYSLQDNNSGEK
jgi:hypothetical protein